MWAAGAGAVLCLIYYAVIVFYSGFSTSFSWIWPAAALFLLALTEQLTSDCKATEAAHDFENLA